MGYTLDAIPVLSQLKSLYQLTFGDAEGARRTQENFRDTGLVASQITSLYHAIGGNNQKAREVQEKFLRNLDEVSDGFPIVGHIKGGIYYALGDNERGENTLKSATGSAASMAAGAAGFIVGGPPGAAAASVAASHAYDGLVTGIDTAIHGTREDGSPRYYGSWNSYDRMVRGEADAGEVFDSVAPLALEAASGAFGGAKLKGRIRSSRPRIRCRRDVEFHLTTEEANFATGHQYLPGSVSEVLTAKWQHLSAPETVSNLVSLFVILRLILWNDKNGRTYSHELCMATEFDHIERCQNGLMKALRDMDDHLALKKTDSEYVSNPNLQIKGIRRNSTKTMIQVVTSLYGILDSMAKGDKIGIAWLAELCAFEDISSVGICEKEVVHKLRELRGQAFTLGEARKHRIKRASGCQNFDSNQGPSHRRQGQSATDNVRYSGPHHRIQQFNRLRDGRYESNHVPAYSSYPKGTSARFLPAHSLPYDIHQIAMAKVGTSKSGRVAVALRKHQKQLIENGNMADAIKLDFAEGYGRANTRFRLANNGRAINPKPALVKYKKGLKQLVDEHRGQERITNVEANNLHRFLDDETNAWNSNKDWGSWMKRAEKNYEHILRENGLPIDQNMYVPQKDRYYG